MPAGDWYRNAIIKATQTQLLLLLKLSLAVTRNIITVKTTDHEEIRYSIFGVLSGIFLLSSPKEFFSGLTSNLTKPQRQYVDIKRG